MASYSETAREIFDRALADCSIERAMARRVTARDGRLTIDGESVELGHLRQLRIVAAGKAANAMLRGLLPLLPPLPGCEVGGVLIAPEPPLAVPEGFQYFRGGHPLPNEASFAGARAALELVRSVEDGRALCLFLISGGASAMMELPLAADISLADTAAFHGALVASGAPIAEMNCARKHFSAVKGGRLALAAGGARCWSLLVSDVPESRQDALGSGPAVADVSTVGECREILDRYGLRDRFPASVRRFFASAALVETPKPGEIPAFSCVLLDSRDLAEAAVRRAESLGWTAVVDNTCDEWEYEAAAQYLLDRVRALRKERGRVCLISAGEVTVRLPFDCRGVGGRNQQFALFSATRFAPDDGEMAVLSAGSDGIDGNSPAAGAVIEARMAADVSFRRAGRSALENFNAFPFLAARNAAILRGASGNNLRDLRILLAG